MVFAEEQCSKYFVGTAGVKYKVAKFVCEKCNATLAVINNNDEYDYLKDL